METTRRLIALGLLSVTSAQTIPAQEHEERFVGAAPRGGLDRTEVRVQRKPGQPWRTYPTRVVRAADGLVATRRSPYGGDATRRFRATGFFRVERVDDRWWLVDPDGCRFVSVGINSVRPPRTPAGKAVLAEEFVDVAGWAEATARLLREHGVNTLGRWTNSRRVTAFSLLRSHRL